MLPRESFENLRTVVTILVLLEQFLSKLSLKFFGPEFKCFTQYDAFSVCIFDDARLGRKANCYQKG